MFVIYTCGISLLGNPSADSADIGKNLNDNDVTSNDDSSNNWFFPQKNPQTTEDIPLIGSPKYGFANKLSGALIAFEVRLCNLLLFTATLMLNFF